MATWLGDFLDDLVGLHPGRLLEDIPGGKFVETTGGKIGWDLINAAANAPGGLLYLATQGPRHPIRVGEEIAKSTYEDFRHPLRHPGYTLLDIFGLVGGAGGVAGRVGAVSAAAERAALASRKGTVAEQLAQAADEGIIPRHLISQEAAERAGATGEFNRLIDTETGKIRTHQQQVRSALLFGPAREERILWPKGVEDLDTPDSVARHGWWYSRDPFIKAAQKMVDRAYETLPETRVAPIWKVLTEGVGPEGRKFGGPLRTQDQRISSAERAWQSGVNKEIRAKGQQLLAKHETLMSPRNWMVLRLIGEGTRPEKMITYYQSRLLDETVRETPRMVNEIHRKIAALREAAEVVRPKEVTSSINNEVRTVNELRPEYIEELGEFIEDFRNLSNERTRVSKLSGVLSEDSANTRAAGPHSLVESGHLIESEARMKHSLAQLKRDPVKNKEKIEELERDIEEYTLDPTAGELAAEGRAMKDYFAGGEADVADFVQQAGLFRVPYTKPKLPFFGAERKVYRRSYKASSRPRVPGTYTHHFTAGVLKHGGGEENVARLIAESYTEAHRFLALKDIWTRIQTLAKPTPAGIPLEHQQLVRLDPETTVGGKLNISQAERSILTSGEIGTKDSFMAGRLLEGIRGHLFPSKESTAKELGLSEVDYARLMGINQSFKSAAANGTPYGYGWIDKRYLGDLYKKNPLIGLYDYTAARKAIRAIDTASQAVKSAMLFLRPAYIFPNMLSNFALNLIQQGMLAPVHMGMNYRLWQGLSDNQRQQVLTQMGESSEKAKFAPEIGLVPGKVSEYSEAAANFYSKFVDKPFRINAWIHEARRQGYETPAQVNKLLSDEKLAKERQAIANSATDEIINYERLGPGEEAFLRRLILFYPFTRGASRYTLNFPKEHPLATGVAGQLGQKGYERSEEIIGPVPVWAEGIMPLEGLGIPFTSDTQISNPAAFSIFGEPSHLGAQALNFFTAHPNPDLAMSQNLPPVYQGLLALLTGGQSNRFAAPFTPLAKIFKQEAFGGIPLFSLYNSLMGRSAIGGPLDLSAYPDESSWHALNRFIFMGGLSPREANFGMLNVRRYEEQPDTYPHH